MSVTTGDTASLNDAAHRPTDAPPSPSTLSYASVMTDHASKPAAPPSDTAPAVGGINPAVVAPDGSITFNAPTDASPPSGPSQGSVDASHPTVLGLLAKGAEETLTSHYLEVAGTAVAAAGITLAIKEAALYVLGGLTTLLGGPEIGVPVFMATEALLTAGTLASAADGLWNWGQGVHDAGEALNNSTDPTKQNAAEKELQQDGSEIPLQ
jgi:hypothetical protein